ncbi:MAG: hypothetical protein Q8941_12105 [Bacteroidota bacterium]|nr:hypothetical protein [Bacteroidota bacterium]
MLYFLIPLLSTINSLKIPFDTKYSDGTCIIIGRIKGGICVGADTRRVFHLTTNGHFIDVLKYDTVCKIRKYGNLYFSASGFDVDPSYSIAETCITNGKSIVQAAETFALAEKEARRKYLENIRVKSPLDFEHYYKELESFRAAFYGFEDSIPKIIDIEFKMISDKTKPVIVKDSTIKFLTLPDTPNFVIMGHTDTTENLLKQSKFWVGKSFQEGIKDLLLAQCVKDSIDVGAPLDILAIFGKSAYKWYEKSGKCTF